MPLTGHPITTVMTYDYAITIVSQLRTTAVVGSSPQLIIKFKFNNFCLKDPFANGFAKTFWPFPLLKDKNKDKEITLFTHVYPSIPFKPTQELFEVHFVPPAALRKGMN